MRRPICVKCQTELRPLENGIAVIDMAWQSPKPAAVIQADLYECPGCKAQIVSGFAEQPLAEHYQDKFEPRLRNARGRTHIYNYEHAADAIEKPVPKTEVLEP